MTVPRHLHEPISEFQEQFVHRVYQKMTGLSCLVNRAEVSAWFDPSSRCTKDTRGIKKFVARGGAQTKAQHSTVVLADTGDGYEEPPAVIAKSTDQLLICVDTAELHI